MMIMAMYVMLSHWIHSPVAVLKEETNSLVMLSLEEHCNGWSTNFHDGSLQIQAKSQKYGNLFHNIWAVRLKNFPILDWLRQGLLVIGLMCQLRSWVFMAMQHLNMLLQLSKPWWLGLTIVSRVCTRRNGRLITSLLMPFPILLSSSSSFMPSLLLLLLLVSLDMELLMYYRKWMRICGR